MATPSSTDMLKENEVTQAVKEKNAEPLNGPGFYRFKIGDFQATVISDGYGDFPVRPDLRHERL